MGSQFNRHATYRATSNPGRTSISVLNMHAEPWGKDGTKKKHIDLFKKELDQVSLVGGIFVAGGDFNEIPPGSPRWKNFSDDVPNSRFGNDDYTGEETWLDELYASYTHAYLCWDTISILMLISHSLVTQMDFGAELLIIFSRTPLFLHPWFFRPKHCLMDSKVQRLCPRLIMHLSFLCSKPDNEFSSEIPDPLVLHHH